MQTDTAKISAGTTVLPATTPAAMTGITFLVLGVAVILTVLGTAAATFRGDGTAINAFLFMEAGFSHQGAAGLERAAVAITLLAAIAGVGWRRWPLFLPAGCYLLLEALARRHMQGEAYSSWALFAHAARYATPFALVMLLLGGTESQGRARWWKTAGNWALRVSLAAVFAIHGLEAFEGNAAFIDLILSTGANLADVHITEHAARAALEVIGIVDFAVAGALLIRPHPAVLGWAAFWAALTAFSRVTANGWGAYPDVLLRATYYLGPIALWMLLARTAADPTPAASVSTR